MITLVAVPRHISVCMILVFGIIASKYEPDAPSTIRDLYQKNNANLKEQMSYQDCRDAMSESVQVCGRPTNTDAYRRCMEDRMGIDVLPQGGTCNRAKTPCVLSSDSATFCAVSKKMSVTPQTVHAVAGMYGGPSKLSFTE